MSFFLNSFLDRPHGYTDRQWQEFAVDASTRKFEGSCDLAAARVKATAVVSTAETAFRRAGRQWEHLGEAEAWWVVVEECKGLFERGTSYEYVCRGQEKRSAACVDDA